MTRNAICLAFVLAIQVQAALTPQQTREIVIAAWAAVRDHFYDSELRGIDWERARVEALADADRAGSTKDVEDIIYGLFRKLNNSHSGLSTPDERRRRAATIPASFDRVAGRLFVCYVSPSQRGTGLRAGAEVSAIDGIRAPDVRLPVKRFHESVEGNPIYGPSGSTAVLATSDGRITVPRLRGVRPDDAVEVRNLSSSTLYVRLNALGGDELPAERIRAVFREAGKYESLVLDLRDCPGGDMRASVVLASILVGPGRDYHTVLPRNGRLPGKVYSKNPPLTSDIEPDVEAGRAVLIRTHAEEMRYRGRLAVLVNGRTSSEPENLAALVKTYKRGLLVGATTQGATHGWSLAVGLPHGFGAVAVPYTRTIMADGREYEGVGIVPDLAVANTADDYAARRDAVLKAALKAVRSR